METTMRKIYWAAPLLLLAFLMVFAFGCTEKTGSGNDGGGSGIVGNVQILMGSDTIRYLPGDSASTTVTVIVTDQAGNVMPGVRVGVALGNPQIGIIEFLDTGLRDTTNAIGQVPMAYRSYATPGLNIISAVAGGRSDVDSVFAEEARDVVCLLTLTTSREFVYTSTSSQDCVTVNIAVSDCNHNGIANVSIPISATNGEVAPPPPTDQLGHTSTTWYLRAPFGMAYISAQAGNLTASDSVEIREVSSVIGTLEVSAQSPISHADNCVQPNMITAILRDADGVGVGNQIIRFAADGGYMLESSDTTASSGIAAKAFCDLGIPSQGTDSAEVVAIYDAWGLRDTVKIWVQEALEITTVSLHVGNNIGTAGVDSTPVTMNVRYSDLSPVTGVRIRFHADCGTFTYPDTTLLFGNVLGNYYHFCDHTGTDRVFAEIGVAPTNMYSDTSTMTVEPGDARYVQTMGAASTLIEIGDTTLVWALIVDSLHNPVTNGQAVVCSTSLGTVNPMIATTDSFGVAHSILNSGTTAGQASVRMYLVGYDVDSLLISVLSDLPASIELNVSNTSPQVAGTGGASTSQLRAEVRDANNNPVPDGTMVGFCIITPGNPEGGENINGVGLCDSAATSGGLAVVTFNAGIIPGPVQIEACTRVETTDICATNTSINIVAGPPRNITIYPNEIGESIGGSAWELEISALVVDTYNNPVRCGTSVFFDVTPDSAQVVSDSIFVCNMNIDNEWRRGIAYSLIQYNSNATFSVVFITARTGGDEPVEEVIEFVLPLQEPSIALTVYPASWHFPTQGNTCQIQCFALVQDGHGVAINGAQVDYYVQRGRLYTACTGGQERYWAISGPAGDPPGQQNGHSFLCLRGTPADIFPDPLTPEITGEVAVEVHGHPEATDSRLILFRRGQGFTDPPIVEGQ